ncbi:toprim domain-containing protein [Salinisphaera sp.]|uniref:DUF7146 domain-containing protein n=1 Tax=Salinisphaera sp. TaxID=1914330 RepID=UPI000C5EE7BA|nr:toprim domain-containing protein [Salinisphaera sp.]MAS09947.1 hypothetical protein [Salinisphaera sp.]|tara:strand:+ start:14520 stop:15467 length:948 start_codon:yes stop_codon:yes gene_type:complete
MSAELREHARGQWRAILAALGVSSELLDGKGRPCPVCGGNDRFTFDDAKGMGTWVCRGCEGGTSGNGFDLVMRRNGVDYATAARSVESVIGRAAQASTGRRGRDPRVRLRQLRDNSKPLDGRDLASRYLKARGVTWKIRDVRFHEAVSYYHDGEHVGDYPAMLSLVRNASGQPVTWHATYLDGAAKLDIGDDMPSKKLLRAPGSVRGGAIRLFRAAHTKLGVAEGIETAIAAAHIFRMPVWAVISTAGMKSFRPPEHVESVTFFGDNDINLAGHAAAYAGAFACRNSGLGGHVMIPDNVGDWHNEWVAIRDRSAA